MDVETFTKYEKARILGARALQVAMNAPSLVKIKQEDLEEIKMLHQGQWMPNFTLSKRINPLHIYMD